MAIGNILDYILYPVTYWFTSPIEEERKLDKKIKELEETIVRPSLTPNSMYYNEEEITQIILDSQKKRLK
tara:strand:- start:1787 stop:1996 length:210 start_codon:yes stop_codon:yes gene_type:complete